MGLTEEAERSLTLVAEATAGGDVETIVTQLSAAVRALTAAGDVRRAAMSCAQLGDVLANGMGNLIAGRAWFSRAARMLENEPPCVEQGWVAVAAMGCDVGDPDELLACAELALERARQFRDINLETKALADAGLAHVQAGRVSDGMALLDEAMALACGPADDLETAGKSACSFFTACYYTADFDRASSWADLLRGHGVIGPAAGSPIFLSNHCDAVQAWVLCELGRWTDAEAILTRADADFEAAMGHRSWHPAIVLADLRIRQGRLVDAEQLLLGKDQAFEALLPTARLHLSRGDHGLAAACAQRGLRALGSDRLRSIELLTVLVDAELGRSDVEAAARACEALDARTKGLDVPHLHARADAARAHVAAAIGDLASAVCILEDAVQRLDATSAQWLRARLLMEAARLRELSGDRAAAAVDAKAAAAALGRLDVVIEPEGRALLDRLGLPSGSAKRLAILRSEGRWWVASLDGVHVRMRGSKGLSYLAELIAHPGSERHALDLVDRVEGPAGRDGVSRRTLGDAGEMLDGAARAAYRDRIEQLRSASDEALEVGDLGRAEALQLELDQLVAQLAQAFGLGGRARRASSAAERARLNVTRAVRAAITRIHEVLPSGGAVLDRRIRTGLYLVYAPADTDEVQWIVQGAVNGIGED